MKKYLSLALVVIALIFGIFSVTRSASAATILFPSGGGTGSSTPAANKLLVGNGSSPINSVGTTSATCAGTLSCPGGFVIIGNSPITLTGSGGGGSSYPFTPDIWGTIAVSATTTPILDYAGIITSTTTAGAFTATSSVNLPYLATGSSRFLTINGAGLVSSVSAQLTIANGGTNQTSFTGGNIVYANSAGTTLTNVGSATSTVTCTSASGVSCTGFVTIGAGGSTIALSAIPNTSLANSTISGVALGGTLAALSATNSTLTFSGSYTGTAAQTVGLNLANANTWTALQQFNAQASSTQESAGRAYFGLTATTTIDGTGNIVVPSGSNITITGKSDGCATFATGVLNSTGVACGSGSGGIGDPFTHDVPNHSATTSTFGFGSTTPFSAVSISTTTANYTGQSLLAVANSTNLPLFNVLGNGNVGIATATPGTLFSVNGSANFTTGTSTILGNGLLSQRFNATATSTFAGVQIGTGGLSIGAINGLLKATSGNVVTAAAGTDYIAGGAGAATTTVSCAGTATCSGFTVFGASPITITGIGIADPFTHAVPTSSATTSTFGIGSSTPFAALSVSTSTSNYTGQNLFSVANSTNLPLFNILGNGNVGVATATPGTLFSINGSANFTTGTSTILGNGLLAAQLAATATSTLAGVYIPTGGLTIGTLTGTKCLHEVSGVVLATASDCGSGGIGDPFTHAVPTSSATTSAFGFGSTTPFAAVSISTTTANYAGQNLLSVADSTNLPLFNVLGNGNVGVGTSTPGSLFSVQGIANLGTGTSTLYSTGFNVQGVFTATNAATSTFAQGINLSSGCFAVRGVCLSASSGLSSYDAWTHAVIGSSATTSAIGIGTTTPFSQLSVSTSTQSSPFTSLFAVASTTNVTLFNVLGSGNVGIGTTSPYANLSVVGTSGTIFAVSSSTVGGSTNPVYRIDAFGHPYAAGPEPTCTLNCDFVKGSDAAFLFKASDAASSITITFTHTWTTAPICTATSATGAAVISASSTPTTIVIGISTATPGKRYSVLCVGNPDWP